MGSCSSKAAAPPPPPQPKSFSDLYLIQEKILGQGAFGVVKEGTHKLTGDACAIKILPKSNLSIDDRRIIAQEVDILKTLHNHPNIITLHQAYNEPEAYYLVMEKMDGGELFDRIVLKSTYNEQEARDTCKILFDAVEFCHKQKVAHRDLKPENLLLVSRNNDSQVKISDFGFARLCPYPESLRTRCGTPAYVAPEIIEGKPYDTRADLWSLGVIVFILLGGYPPFSGQGEQALYGKIRRGDWHFNEKYWDNVSDSAKDMIRTLLTVNFKQRSLKHTWLQEADLESHNLDENLNKFRIFNAKRKFRAAIHTVNATKTFQSFSSIEKEEQEEELYANAMESFHPAVGKLKQVARSILAANRFKENGTEATVDE